MAYTGCPGNSVLCSNMSSYVAMPYPYENFLMAPNANMAFNLAQLLVKEQLKTSLSSVYRSFTARQLTALRLFQIPEKYIRTINGRQQWFQYIAGSVMTFKLPKGVLDASLPIRTAQLYLRQLFNLRSMLVI